VLSVEQVRSSYGRIEALHGVSIEVAGGEIVTLLGANGAGKSTLIRAISGVQAISAGQIRFDDRPLEGVSAHARVALGIAQVPEGRQVFAPLSVEDNLRLGAWPRRNARLDAELASVYELFPVLASRRRISAGMLSGGEQQMLAIGRALMTNPRLLVLDEATEGLAPVIREEIWRTLGELKREGLAQIVIDKNVGHLLRLADLHYVIEKGRIVWQGDSQTLRGQPDVVRQYLGV